MLHLAQFQLKTPLSVTLIAINQNDYAEIGGFIFNFKKNIIIKITLFRWKCSINICLFPSETVLVWISLVPYKNILVYMYIACGYV